MTITYRAIKALPLTHAELDANFTALDAFATPEAYGAVSGGVVDAKAALTTALATGRMIDGGGLTYGISGKLSLPANARLRNITLKQLAPAATQAVTTLEANGVSNVWLENVKVNRNGSGTNAGTNALPNGELGTAFAVNIYGGTYHRIVNLEVYGDDTGTGIRLYGLDRSSIVRNPYVRDMMGVLASATDDVVQGMRIDLCDGLVIHNPTVERLGWRALAGDATLYTNSRGITFSGCTGVTLIAPRTKSTGQGIDISGNLGSGNVDCTIMFPVVENCDSWGIKYANTTRRAKTYGGRSYNCAMAGFVDSSSWDAAVTMVDVNTFENCDAIDCGNAGSAQLNGTTVSTHFGFGKLSGSRTYVTPVRFIRCRANDSRGTSKMTWGFYSEVAQDASRRDEAIDCAVSGAVTNDFRGIISQSTFEAFTRRSATRTLTSQTALQNMFASTEDELAITPGVYEFWCDFTLSSMSASSGDFGFAVAGTATFTGRFNAWSAKVADITAPHAHEGISTATLSGTSLVTASTATTGEAHIHGWLTVTVAGTLIPQVSLGVAAAAVLGSNSTFKIRKMASASANNSDNIRAGAWS
jgi:hypothetical protein